MFLEYNLYKGWDYEKKIIKYEYERSRATLQNYKYFHCFFTSLFEPIVERHITLVGNSNEPPRKNVESLSEKDT